MAWAAAALTILQLGSTVLSGIGSHNAEKKQEEYYNWYKKENEKAVKEDLRNNIALTNLQYQQEIEASSLESQQAWLENEQAQATAEASALENGLGGNSLASLMQGYERASAVNDYVAAKNLEMKGMQVKQNIKSLEAKAQSAINLGVPFSASSMNGFSMSGSVLGGIGSALSIYSDAQWKASFNNKNNNATTAKVKNNNVGKNTIIKS